MSDASRAPATTDGPRRTARRDLPDACNKGPERDAAKVPKAPEAARRQDPEPLGVRAGKADPMHSSCINAGLRSVALVPPRHDRPHWPRRREVIASRSMSSLDRRTDVMGQAMAEAT